jgi:hypothetical protein
MKNSSFKISLAVGILMLTIPGCLDIWITTQVRPDGSLVQSIAFQGDSSEIVDVRFACMKEEGWTKEWTKPEKDKYKLVISKEFKSVKDLNASMNPADSNMLVVRTHSTLHRKFRWFFTRFVFEETVVKSNPFPSSDYHQYLTDEEVRLIALSEEARKTDPAYDSLKYKQTEKRFEDYLFRSMYEDFHCSLLSVLRDDHSLTLGAGELNARKEEIYHFLVDSLKGDSSDAILTAIGKFVKHPDIEVIKSKYIDRFEGFQNRMNFHESASDDNYKFAIRMPGLLLQTNSPKIEGAQAGWELTYYDFFFREFTMKAESRTVNTWAFIVAGLLLLAALTGLVTVFRRKR